MRAQVAAEFVMYAALAMIIVSGVMFFINGYYVEQKNERIYYETTELGRTLQKELIVVSQVNKGITRKIIVPEKILGEDYSINTHQDQIEIIYKDSSQYFDTPLITGTLTKGENTIRSNETTIIIN